MASPSRTLATPITLLSRRSTQLYQPYPHHRTFTSTTRILVNPLSNLSHFSAAKEAQFLSKEKRIPREEFHPYLQLIRSSEVDPYAPVPGASPSVIAALNHAKSGEADTDTALRLAVANLIDQLKASNREKEEILRVLSHIQDRYRREERNALLMLFACFGMLAVVTVKTRAVEDMVGWVRGQSDEWNAFDWGWLGTSSDYLPKLKPEYISMLESPARESKRNLLSLPDTEKRERQSREVPRPVQVVNPPFEQTESRGTLSRLFWASNGSK